MCPDPAITPRDGLDAAQAGRSAVLDPVEAHREAMHSSRGLVVAQLLAFAILAAEVLGVAWWLS